MARLGRPKGVSKETITLTIEKKTLNRFKKGCDRKGVLFNATIERLIASWLKAQITGRKNGLENLGKHWKQQKKSSIMLKGVARLPAIDPYSLPVLTEDIISADAVATRKDGAQSLPLRVPSAEELRNLRETRARHLLTDNG